MENEPTFKGCMVKKTRHYFKQTIEAICLASIIVVGIIALAYVYALFLNLSWMGSLFILGIWILITGIITSSIINDNCLDVSVKSVIYSWFAANILAIVGILGLALFIMCYAVIPVIVAFGVLIIFNFGWFGAAFSCFSLIFTIPINIAYIECIKLWDWIGSCFRITESLLYGWIKSSVRS